jgi:PKD repeat protein
LLLPLLILFAISITTTFAQSELNYLYFSGQIANTANGRPITQKEVYIQSDLAVGGGITYIRALTTDNMGFIYDTIVTSAIKGKLTIRVSDTQGELHEAIEYFRFNWEAEHYMNIRLEIDDYFGAEFQANFIERVDTLDPSKMTYEFTDISNGYGINSWNWDFGDGFSSTNSQPKHTYTTPGIYDVKLTINSDIFSAEIGTSEIVKKLKVGMKDYFHFGGHAFAGYFPVDLGTAYLYQVIEDEYIPIDTTEFDEYGYYMFPQLINGNYKVKTFPSPNSTHAGAYLPTYFGNELLWTKAQTIYLSETGWEYDIVMVENSEYNTGDGNIEGRVFVDGKTATIENAAVILFNETDNCLTYIKSDKEGAFIFTGLAYGTYKVLADIPGKYTYPSIITLSANNPTIADIDIIVYEEDIAHGIGDEIETRLTGLGDPYPNPARSYVNIEFMLKESGQVQVFVFNQSGQIVDKYSAYHHSGDNKVHINTSGLTSGMYKMMLLFGNEKHVKSFVRVK